MSINRRKFERIPLILKLEVYDKKSTGRVCTGVTSNISAGGLGLQAHAELKKDEIYTLIFSLSADSKPIRVKGKVCWTYSSDIGPLHGIEFIKLGLFNRFKIKRFINKALFAEHGK
ncbi:MAG: PilZ domain-containing protein [Elusimicrobiota bacterium]